MTRMQVAMATASLLAITALLADATLRQWWSLTVIATTPLAFHWLFGKRGS